MNGSGFAILEAGLVDLRCDEMGVLDLILSSIAFSMILDRCDLTTMGLISSKLQGPLVKVFCSGTSLPTRRYSGIYALLSESGISCITFAPSNSFFMSTVPSKQSGPSPLLMLDCLKPIA
jgi:hypothetical protein